MISELFDEVYLLNLPQFEDKLKLSVEQLTSIGIDNFKVFDGEIVNEGKTFNDRHQGCTNSHFRIIKHAKEQGYKRILIFEDDIEFSADFNSHFEKIKDFIDNNEWNFFYLGGNIKDTPVPYNSSINRANLVHTTHAYAINSCCFDTILNIENLKRPIDVIWASEVNSLNKSFILNPRIAFQRAGLSYIIGQYRDYKGLREKKGVKY